MVPFASRVFLWLLIRSWGPPNLSIFSPTGNSYIHNATTQRVRSGPKTAKKASFRARIVANNLGPSRHAVVVPCCVMTSYRAWNGQLSYEKHGPTCVWSHSSYIRHMHFNIGRIKITTTTFDADGNNNNVQCRETNLQQRSSVTGCQKSKVVRQAAVFSVNRKLFYMLCMSYS